MKRILTIQKKRNKSGFSLIELSIAVAVLAVLAGVFAPVISQGIDVMLTIRTKEILLSDANLAMRFMTADYKYDFGGFNSYSAADTNNNSVLWSVNKAGTQFICYRVEARQDTLGVWHQDLIRITASTSPYTELSNVTVARDVPNGGFKLVCFPALTGTRIPFSSATPVYCSGTQGYIQISLTLRDPRDANMQVDLITRIRPGQN